MFVDFQQGWWPASRSLTSGGQRLSTAGPALQGALAGPGVSGPASAPASVSDADSLSTGPLSDSEPSVLMTPEPESHKLWHKKSSIRLHLPLSLLSSPPPRSLEPGWGRARKLTTGCHIPLLWLSLLSPQALVPKLCPYRSSFLCTCQFRKNDVATLGDVQGDIHLQTSKGRLWVPSDRQTGTISKHPAKAWLNILWFTHLIEYCTTFLKKSYGMIKWL